jgi:hypothetical protein
MKRPILHLSLFLIPFFSLQAQQSKLTIDVVNNTDPSIITLLNPYAITCGNNVVVVNEYTDDVSTIEYFKEGRIVWKAQADKEYSRKSLVEGRNLTAYDKRLNFMVGSNNGAWVYNVELKPDAIDKKDHYVTQVSLDGTVKKFTIEAREEFGKQLQTAFCDDQYFYYLITEEGDELGSKKKASEKLILNRFDARDFTYNRYALNLPAVEPGDNNTFWSFLGQTETEKLLVSKHIDYENEKIVFTIVAFDNNGNIVRTFKIEPTLDKKFIRPSNHIKSPLTNFHQQAEFDYYPKVTQGSSYATVSATESSFGNIIFDQESQRFFVFGLTGPKPFKKIGPVQDGFYVIAYNIKGTLDWQLQVPAPSQLMSEDFFRVHALPGYRYVYLKNNPDNSLGFYIQFKKSRFSWPISADGKAGKHTVMKDTRVMADPYVFNLTK